jgi:hypothetical protein
MQMMKTDVERLIRRCYEAFNDRDLEGAVALMHADVIWPNGWEGGWVYGRDGVRNYWQRQWATIDPRVEPRAFRWDAEERVIVSVHQTVRDLAGAVLSEQMVEHVYEMKDGLVRRMEILGPEPQR